MEENANWDMGDAPSVEASQLEYTSEDPEEDEYRKSFGLRRTRNGNEWELVNRDVLLRIGPTSTFLSSFRHFLGLDLNMVTWSRKIVDNPYPFMAAPNSERSELHYYKLYDGHATRNHLGAICNYLKKRRDAVDESKTYARLNESRRILVDVLADIEGVLGSLPDEVKQFQEFRKRFHSEVQNFKRVLGRKFPVVIVGDMKSGKSTLINALLGDALMYVDINPATIYVCEIHNSGVSTEERRIEFVDENGEVFSTIELNNLSDAEARQVVTDVLKQPRAMEDSQGPNQSQLSLVRLHWPLPVLPENIVLVDTPGVNEGQFFQNIVSRYLSEQQQFCLCAVINSTTAASTDTTDLIRTFAGSIKAACANFKQYDMEIDELKANLLKNCLFILNRWDTLTARPPVRNSDDEPFFRAFSTWAETFRRIEPILSDLGLKGARNLQVDQLVPLSAKIAYYSKRLDFPSFHLWNLEHAFSSLAVRGIRGDLMAVSDQLQYLMQSFSDECRRFIRGVETRDVNKALQAINQKIEYNDSKLKECKNCSRTFCDGVLSKLHELLISKEKKEAVSDLVSLDVMNACVVDDLLLIQSLPKKRMGELISLRLSAHLRPDLVEISETVAIEIVSREVKLDNESGEGFIRPVLCGSIFGSFASKLSRKLHRSIRIMTLHGAVTIVSIV